ncbi:MAG: hypothetical protein H0X66_05865 [Verrucomicrobia bacterium]|nr:hypothetical protein [Verrucomicrobiota bacterium]
MNRWKVILATLVIFASGVATGLFLSEKEPGFEPAAAAAPRVLTPGAPPPASWQVYQKDFLRRLNNEVTLAPEQRERVAAALKESQERTKAIRDKIAPELREEVKRVREQIRSELTPEQQAKFDEAMKKPAPRKDKEDKPDEEKRRRPLKNISKGEESSQPAS